MLCGLLLTAWITCANASKLNDQQRQFQDARTALKKGHLKRFRRLKSQLAGYPLQGYLDYLFLSQRLSSRPDKEILAFFAANDHAAYAIILRKKWLHQLARQGKWRTFLNEYRVGLGDNLYCRQLQARLKTSSMARVKDDIQTMWLVGKSQPKSCNNVFKQWIGKGHLTTALVWQRIDLAMANRKLSLARYLSRFLNKQDSRWVERWIRMHRRPKQLLHASIYKKDTAIIRKIVAHGIQRLALIDAESAHEIWQKIKGRYRFEKKRAAEIQRYIALRAAYQGKPQALLWLTLVDPQAVNDRVREWRIRTAISLEDWAAVLVWVNAMDASKRNSSRWRYWRARALEQRKRIDEANKLYALVAMDRDYHGFLSADRLKIPYSMNDRAVDFNEHELMDIGTIPGIARAREFYHLGYHIDARREWNHTIQGFSPRQLQLAAVLAQQWGWHDRAILTVARAKHYSDLKMRFPIVYRKQVEHNAKKFKLEPAWIFGVLRQESAYMHDARSLAGALGLMQLMPRTARHVGRLIKSPLRRNRDLLNADKNIRLGSAYLRRVLDNNKGNQVLATASYNAGVQRVRQWIAKDKSIEADIWIESVPFNETRDYIRRVMTYTAIFENRLGKKITPISKRMPLIKPAL